jgi:hypothetical protein
MMMRECIRNDIPHASKRCHRPVCGIRPRHREEFSRISVAERKFEFAGPMSKSVVSLMALLDETCEPNLKFRMRSADEATTSMLSSNPPLARFVEEVADHMMDYFRNAEVVVERFVDPEATTPVPLLFVVAKVVMSPDDAMGLLDRFDDEWWLDNKSRGAGIVRVSVDTV